MQIGYIGLGKMGYNMATRLLNKGYNVVAYNRSKDPLVKIEQAGATTAKSLPELCQKLSKPRLIWVMVPNSAIEEVLNDLIPNLSKSDTVIDGGNTFYKDTVARAKRLEKLEINLLDAGVSGGPSGALNGASIMVGGEKHVFEKYENLFKDLSVENGYAYLGKSGAGHFVKMVHNGIEYGMMQAIAEGFDILKSSEFNLDLNKVLMPYNNGSVIESRLIGWLKSAYAKHSLNLEGISGKAAHSGEGLWTIKTAREMGVDVEVIEQSFKARLKSQKSPSYQGKIIQALRGEFGGHHVRKD
jgi:6-phosphogluconate dehydrogenase